MITYKSHEIIYYAKEQINLFTEQTFNSEHDIFTLGQKAIFE